MSYMDDFFNNTQLFIPESFDEVRTYAKQIEYLADWCTELEDAIGTDRDYQDIKERVSLLETEYEALSEKLSTDEGVLTTHTSEIESIKTQIADIKADIEILQTGKQDKLTAGAGISIENNVISATGGGGGSTVSVTVGTTTTGDAGTDASVVNSGTAENVVLNFTIPRGATGEAGPEGPIGPTGPQGDVGPQGPQGDIGPQGPQGEKGDAGPQGPQGDVGPQGPAGTSPTVTVGTTTTGEAGTDASVVNSGTAENVVLNFTIPRGATGPQGDVGPQGPQGVKGDTGEIGPEGPQGPAGTSPTVTVGTTTTGEAGTDASVVNSGTAENVVLDFTIPGGQVFVDSFGYPITNVFYRNDVGIRTEDLIDNADGNDGILNIVEGYLIGTNGVDRAISQTVYTNNLQFGTEQQTASGYTPILFSWTLPNISMITIPDSILYVHLTSNIVGQIRLTVTGISMKLQLGYTKDLSGKAVNIPADTTIRFRIPII